MNLSLPKPIKALTIEEFIETKENELSFCKKLSEVGFATDCKEFSLTDQFIHCVEAAVEECNLLLQKCNQPYFYNNHSKIILHKVKLFNDLINYLKKASFNLKHDLTQFAEEEIRDCKELNSSSVTSDPEGIRYAVLIEKLNYLNNLIKSLKKKTHLFGNTKVYEDDILRALETATKEFQRVAD